VRGYTVTRIWGIPIRIGTSLIVFMPVLVWLIASGGQIEAYAGLIATLSGTALDAGALRAGVTPWVVGTLAAVGLFVSVTLHELGHSYVARRYGIGIESITLWVLGGLAALESIPREWDREFWIAIAGPAVSLLTAVGCFALLVVIPAGLTIPRFVVGWLALTNVALTVFNLLPAFPMDGGRIFRALLARNRPYASATRIAARVGVIFAVLFAVVGVLGFNVIMLFLALFIYGAATTESRTVLLDELLTGLTVADLMTPDPPTSTPSETIADLGDRMLADRRTRYPVVADGRVAGIVTLADLKGARGSGATVADVMRDPVRLDPEEDAFEAFARLGSARTSEAVVERDGRLVGVVSEEEFGHALTVRRGFQSSFAG
jgi:Zn-dependent protease/CBS domain-containing protein